MRRSTVLSLPLQLAFPGLTYFSLSGANKLERFYTRLEKLTNDKHSSLLQKFTAYGSKQLCKVEPSTKVSVCYIRLEKLTNDKHSSLLRKFTAYGRKKFHKVEPSTKLECLLYWTGKAYQ
jgi:hypothetical protein